MEHSTAAVALQAFVGQADAQFHDLAQGLGQWVLASPRTLAEVEQHTLAAIKEVGQQVLAGACQLAVVATPTPPTTPRTQPPAPDVASALRSAQYQFAAN